MSIVSGNCCLAIMRVLDEMTDGVDCVARLDDISHKESHILHAHNGNDFATPPNSMPQALIKDGKTKYIYTTSML